MSHLDEQQLTQRLRVDAARYRRPTPVDLHSQTMTAIRTDVLSPRPRRACSDNRGDAISPGRPVVGSMLAAMVTILTCLAAAISTQSASHMPTDNASAHAAMSGDVGSSVNTAASGHDDASHIAQMRRAFFQKLQSGTAQLANNAIKAEMQAIVHDFATARRRLIARTPRVLRETFGRQPPNTDA